LFTSGGGGGARCGEWVDFKGLILMETRGVDKNISEKGGGMWFFSYD
jgi:hypothetical protein